MNAVDKMNRNRFVLVTAKAKKKCNQIVIIIRVKNDDGVGGWNAIIPTIIQSIA